jgi:hypothetical protein
MKKLIKDIAEGTGEMLDAITSNGRKEILPEEEKDEDYNELLTGFDNVLDILVQRILHIQKEGSDSCIEYFQAFDKDAVCLKQIHDLVESYVSVQGQLIQLAKDIESCNSKS